MHQAVLFAALVFAFTLMLYVNGNVETVYTCSRGDNYPCAYPEVCTQCPQNITEPHGHGFFYYNKDQKSCVHLSGTSKSCNAFTDNETCRIFCGLDD
uniref:Pancreatic trypsin inhibitor n=1 Tax=Rhipicephalus appendiculatus TaxID=34631 RepID=A0A131YA87_RHIAP